MEFDSYFLRLKDFCESENFKGYDPFDGLNSSFFQALPIIRNISLFRLAWIQFFKQSPINLRPLFGIKKDYNPKGLGLFLSAYCNLYRVDPDQQTKDAIYFLINKIYACQSTDYSGICWGYNFDWQARAFFQPKGTPSIVVSSYIACALLDAYEILPHQHLLDTARSTCDFILSDLHRTYDEQDNFAFSYSTVDQTQVFNASLLGSRLLCRVYKYTREPLLIEEARKAVAYVCNYQHFDGSWAYSNLPFHQWIDNFHTGYNLECIHTYQTISEDYSFFNALEKGLNYYLDTFFEEDGTPRYYNTSRYPIDMHTTAQLIITLSKMDLFDECKPLIDKVLSWSQENMFSPNQGYFYYCKRKYFTNRINYMRWTQAWMLLAYSHYILNTEAISQ